MNAFDQPFFTSATAPDEICDRLVELAAQGDWTGYLALAAGLGDISPAWAASLDSDYSWSPAPDPLFHGLGKHPDPLAGAGELLSLAPVHVRQPFLDACLLRLVETIDALPLRDADKLAEFFVAQGARANAALAFDPAVWAAASGKVQLLAGMLHGGMNPRGLGGRKLPLIALALHKQRAYSLSSKMAAAEALSAGGATVLEGFAHPLPGQPRSLLEVALLQLRQRPQGLTASALSPDFGWEQFEFPWNYYEDAGLPIEELLPNPDDSEGLRRLEALIHSSQTEPWELPLPGQRASFAWLASALDVAQLWIQARDLGAPLRRANRSL